MEGSHTVTVRTVHIVLAARIVQVNLHIETPRTLVTLLKVLSRIQVIAATSQFAFSTTLCLWNPGEYWYGYYNYVGPMPLWALVPVLALSIPMCLIASIGIFSCRRPNDIHWYVSSTLWYVDSNPSMQLTGAGE
jgi:hypothetical protein